MLKKINPRVLYTVLSGLLILVGSILAIQYAQGKYRFTKQGVSKETGLLAANSFPTGAQVYIDGELVTATDDTLYLKPGEYQVELKKDGYWPWQKKLTIQPTLVTQTNAQLFPIAPSLTPLTFTGVTNIHPSPDGQKILYYTASASAQTKNGLYVLELSDSFLSLKNKIQISDNYPNLDLAQADIIWSPDSSEVILLTKFNKYLLDLNKKNNLNTNLSNQEYLNILSQWEEEAYLKERQFLAKFPEEIIQLATQSAKDVYLSADKKRLLYTAIGDFKLKANLVPPVPAANTQPESRKIEEQNIYIYDREEDKNFLVGSDFDQDKTDKNLLALDLFNKQALSLEASPSAFLKLQATSSAQTAQNFNAYHSALFADSFQWHPDSKHLIYIEDHKIKIKSYDNTNETVVYAGPFSGDFVYPWPNGNKLLILTSFSPDSPLNLYAVELR